MRRVFLVLALLSVVGATGLRARAASIEDAVAARRAGDWATAEQLASEVAVDDSVTSVVRRQAKMLLMRARGHGGFDGLEAAIDGYRSEMFGADAPTTGARALFDAMRLRHAMASGDSTAADQWAGLLLMRSRPESGDDDLRALSGEQAITALGEFFESRYGRQGYEQLMGLLRGPARSGLALSRFAESKKPSDAVSALGELSLSGAPKDLQPYRVRALVRSASRSGAWEPMLGRRGYFEALTATARRVRGLAGFGGVVELLNEEATQAAIELRNARLAGIDE